VSCGVREGDGARSVLVLGLVLALVSSVIGLMVWVVGAWVTEPELRPVCAEFATCVVCAECAVAD
jgi:hypothetical protein